MKNSLHIDARATIFEMAFSISQLCERQLSRTGPAEGLSGEELAFVRASCAFLAQLGERSPVPPAPEEANVAVPQRERLGGVIRAAGPGGLTLGELARKTQWFTARQRNSIVQELEDSGKVVREKQVTATKPASVFRWVEG